MTEGVLTPQGDRFSVETDNSVLAACAGQAEYRLPSGDLQRFPAVYIDLKHHWTGNQHSLILSIPAARSLIQVLNAAISQTHASPNS